MTLETIAPRCSLFSDGASGAGSSFLRVAGALFLGGLLLGSPSAEVEAQSLLSAGGLGFLVDAPDARSRMLGGSGIGLSGSQLLPYDPAAAARISLPGATATMEAGVETPDDGERAGRTRFPNMGIVYPQAGLTFFATFSGYLNQEWRATATPTVDFGGRDVQARDEFEGSGGISAARLGVAREFGDRIAIGIAAGTWLGSIERRFRRDLNPSDVGFLVEPYVVEGVWRAGGATVVGGVNLDLAPAIHLAASVAWSNDLTLSPAENTIGDDVVVPFPTELRVGAYGSLAPELGVAVSAYTADWSATAAALGDDAAPGRVWQWGGGLEWAGTSLLGRRIPLAVGYRQRDLPFSFLGNPASERAFTGGAGLFLVEGDGTPMARLELGMEVGSRSTAEWDESFLRSTVTLRLSGF